MTAYAIGQTDIRPWGRYEVQDLGRLQDGREFCEKIITVHPGHILSLQSHSHRSEIWQVLSGTLTGILDQWRISIEKGHAITIPLGSIHTMANLGTEPLIVREMQHGRCYEMDITRYCDAYGRTHAQSGPPGLYFSMTVYKNLLDEINALPKT